MGVKKAAKSNELIKIRPDLNLEKWPMIWQTSKSRKNIETRKYEREIKNDEREVIKSFIEILPVKKYGDFTVLDQRVYYALLKIWEDKGKPQGITNFSLNGLAKMLNLSKSGSALKDLTDSLWRLHTTTFQWYMSYYNKQTNSFEKMVEGFHILSRLKLNVSGDGHTIRGEKMGFQFNDFMVNNLRLNHTSPILFNVICDFTTDIGQILYTHVDLILAKNPGYERNTLDLFKDLGLCVETYKYPSKRKEALTKPLDELKGKPLSSGEIISSATIEKSVSKKDYKVKITKGTTIFISADEVATLKNQTSELLKFFHKRLFDTDESHPTEKEKEQAQKLIKDHGFEKAKYIVDFAVGDVLRQNFPMKSFGLVLNYQTEALAAHQRHIRELEEEENRKKRLEEEEKICRLRAEKREEYRNYLSEKVADLRTKVPLLTAQIDQIVERMRNFYIPIAADATEEQKQHRENMKEIILVDDLKDLAPEFEILVFEDWMKKKRSRK